MPHIKLTPGIISLSSEENLLYQSVNYKQDLASRLLKLLMISRMNKIPILLLERLKWELGLPLDYEKALIPEFLDYFRVIGDNNLLGENEKELELVCWSDEFAVSEVEKKGGSSGKTEFMLKFSKEFEMDKKYKKWLDEWQKLPYVSPYKNAMDLGNKSDESDKWVVAVLHELLNLFVGKKAEKESLLCLGEFLGLRPSFKRALLQHPGIFYVSSKIGTHTVVLREAYKRGMLIERHPLISMRSNYIKLMNVVKDDNKSKTSEKKKKKGVDVKKSEGDQAEDGEDTEEDSDDEMYGSSDDESEDSGEVVEAENVTKRGRREIKGRDRVRNNTRDVGRKIYGSDMEEVVMKGSTKSSGRTNVRGGEMLDSSDDDDESDDESDDCGEVIEVENVRKRGRHDMNDREYGRKDARNVARSSERSARGTDLRGGGMHKMAGRDFERRNSRSTGRPTNGRSYEENGSKSFTRTSSRANVRGGGMHEMKGEDFERGNSRGMGRRANGRGAEENVRSSSRAYVRGGDDDAREVVNVNNRGRYEMKGRDFERRNTRSMGRRENGGDTEEKESRFSTRSPRRSSARADESIAPRLLTKKPDFSGNRGRSGKGRASYSGNRAT